MSDKIKNEIDKASFIFLQADKTTDCAMHAQLSIIIRYVYKTKTCERFLGFYKVSDDKSAQRITDFIATTLNCFDNAINKLVIQMYDGAAVMIGTLSRVQSRLKSKDFTHAHFMHCYAHKLNLVLSKSAEKVTGVKMFFCIYSHLVNLHPQVPNQKVFSGNLISAFHHCAKQDGVTELEQ